ncbi:MAG TPA: nucleotidyl transferase AbiEii/AbiGii toxin family protein [Anaerolineales bacterium]|nr:nucleotidyl transferase AbiEii/AbiGii toxin family protein [Anaerolineales bacterium]
MANPSAFYFDVLYPFQDLVLKVVNGMDTDFYLTGGTASSRGYLQHRFSDDLDFFLNDDDRFGLWVERVINSLIQVDDWKCQVLMKEERFARLNLTAKEVALKLEFVNDVPARVGEIQTHPVLGRMDSAENILANKVTAALDRDEPKDLADIWGFCCQKEISLKDAITNAQSKAAGVFPADLGRVLCSASRADWEAIRWINAPPAETFIEQLIKLGEGLLLP